MSIKNREELKAYFRNGTIPSQRQFADLIDSMLSKKDDKIFGVWKPDQSYTAGDIVIFDQSIWIMVAGVDEPLALCSEKAPNTDPAHWQQLILSVDDDDWEIVKDENGDASYMYARVVGNIGIGTENPIARLDIRDEGKGQYLFGDATHPGPEFMIINLDPACDQNYLLTALDGDQTVWTTDAPAGYVFRSGPERSDAGGEETYYTEGAEAPALRTAAAVQEETATLMVIRPEGRVGIGTEDPAARLDVSDEGHGKLLLDPANAHGPALSILNTSKECDANYLSAGVGQEGASFSTDAESGYFFRKGADAESAPFDTGERLLHIHPNGKLTAGDPENGTGQIVLDTKNGKGPYAAIHKPAKDAGKGGFLSTGMTGSQAVLMSNAEKGFAFHSGKETKGPEDLKESGSLVVIKQDGKVGIGTDAPEAKLQVKSEGKGSFQVDPDAEKGPLLGLNADKGSNELTVQLSKESADFSTRADSGFAFREIKDNGSPKTGAILLDPGSKEGPRTTLRFSSKEAGSNYATTSVDGKQTSLVTDAKQGFAFRLGAENAEDKLSAAKILVSMRADAKVGINTADPEALLHAKSEAGQVLLDPESQGGPEVQLRHSQSGKRLRLQLNDETAALLSNAPQGFVLVREAGDERLRLVQVRETGGLPQLGVGTGANGPRAMLDVTDGAKGQFLMQPEGAEGPLFTILNLNADVEGNYFVSGVEQAALMISDAPEGFIFRKGPEYQNLKGSLAGGDHLMVVRMNDQQAQVGIGTENPGAMLEVFHEHTGQLLFNASYQETPTLSIVHPGQQKYLASGLDDRKAIIATDAHEGIFFRRGASLEKSEGRIDLAEGKDLVTIRETGRVGIGTNEPRTHLDITNGESGRFMFNLDQKVNPALSIVNLRPGSRENYLAVGVDNDQALLVTDSDYGFTFRSGGESGTNDHELDINQGRALLSIRPEGKGKIGVGKLPEDYEADIHGMLRAFGLYIDTDESKTEVLGEIKDALKKVMKLRPVRFVWNSNLGLNVGEQLGFMAHEVDDVFPQAVRTNRDSTKAVAYQNLVSVLVGAMQEQQKEIDALRKNVEDQEVRLRKLERLMNK